MRKTDRQFVLDYFPNAIAEYYVIPMLYGRTGYRIYSHDCTNHSRILIASATGRIEAWKMAKNKIKNLQDERKD